MLSSDLPYPPRASLGNTSSARRATATVLSSTGEYKLDTNSNHPSQEKEMEEKNKRTKQNKGDLNAKGFGLRATGYLQREDQRIQQAAVQVRLATDFI